MRSVHHLGIDTVQAISANAAFDIPHVLQIVSQVIHTALREHDVVVQFLAESFPKLERLFVQQGGFGPEIVRANDGGVAARIAAADPALLEHSDIADAVFLGQVESRGKTMPAATDNNYIVVTLGLRLAPGCVPIAVVAQRIFQQAKCRVLFHLDLLT